MVDVVDKEVLKGRNRESAWRIIRLTESLPHESKATVNGRQLLRSGTSVGVNCRAKSTADPISKMGKVEEETDESAFWMGRLVKAGITKVSQLKPSMQEADELIAMTISSINTAKRGPKNA